MWPAITVHLKNALSKGSMPQSRASVKKFLEASPVIDAIMGKRRAAPLSAGTRWCDPPCKTDGRVVTDFGDW